jgi:hypothetical protein
MKNFFLLCLCILFFLLTGFFNNCNKEKIICQKCIDKNAKACHKGFCRYLLSAEEIEKTDKAYYSHINQ